MDSVRESLDELRRDIDRIDEGIHDLVMRRAEVVMRIAARKRESADGSYRPAREAQLVRRLVGRHAGPLPVSVIVGIWRQMLGASLALQGPLRVGFFDPPGGEPSCALMASAHFGQSAAYVRHTSAAQAVQAVAGHDVTVGVLPMPASDEEGAWWPLLAHTTRGRPIVVARLPFFTGPGNGGGREALVLACLGDEPSGDDRSLVVLEDEGAASRGAVRDALVEVGHEVGRHLVWRHPGPNGSQLHLVELKGHVRPEDDRRIAAAGKRLGGVRAATRIGGYAVPLALDQHAG